MKLPTTHLAYEFRNTYICGKPVDWRTQDHYVLTKHTICAYMQVDCPTCKESWEYIEAVIEHAHCEPCRVLSEKISKYLQEFTGKE